MGSIPTFLQAAVYFGHSFVGRFPFGALHNMQTSLRPLLMKAQGESTPSRLRIFPLHTQVSSVGGNSSRRVSARVSLAMRSLAVVGRPPQPDVSPASCGFRLRSGTPVSARTPFNDGTPWNIPRGHTLGPGRRSQLTTPSTAVLDPAGVPLPVVPKDTTDELAEHQHTPPR